MIIYDSSSRGEIRSKKSSSFLSGPRVPIMPITFSLWTVIEIAINIVNDSASLHQQI